MTDTKSTDNQFIAFGGAIKAMPDGVIEGHLVPFYTDARTRDWDGEYFSAQTDYDFDHFPVEGRPVTYRHGLDEALGHRAIGKVLKSKVDDIGIWVQAQLDMRDEWEKAVYELAKEGKLGWSSGAWPQSVEVEKDGHIKSWKIIEAALTPTPADPTRITQINTLKTQASFSLREALKPKEATNDATRNRDLKACNDEDQQYKQNEGETTMTLEEFRAKLMQLLDEYVGEMKQDGEMPEEEAAAIVEAMADIVEETTMEDMPEDETKEDALEKMDEEEVKSRVQKSLSNSKVLQAMFKAGFEAQAQYRLEHQKNVKNAMNAARNSANLPVNDRKANAGRPAASQSPRIDVGANLRYAHLSAEELALGVKLAHSSLHPSQKARATLTDLVNTGALSEEFVTYASHAASRGIDGFQPSTDRLIAQDHLAAKSARPFKANELEAVAITNQGAEWISTFYDATVWTRARDNTELLNLMTSKGMRVVDIPQGARTMDVKLNTSSPTVYTRSEPQSVGSDGRPETTARITPWGTDQVTVNAAEHVLATSYSHQLDEDSIINIVQFLNADIQQTMVEATEDAFINGDTTTTASTNINLIDGTPGVGSQKPLYLAWDGIRHNFLVDYTAQAVDNAAGALEATDLEDLIKLFPSQIKGRRDQMLFISDEKTDSEIRKLPEILTDDVLSRGGTVHMGEIPNLFRVQYYMSGFMNLSNGAGKISATSSNNTQGTIALVFAPYWQYGRKRAITIETERDAQAGATIFVASMRHVLTARGQYAANGLYDIAVS